MQCQICDGTAMETVGTAAQWLAAIPAAATDERRRILSQAGRAGWTADFTFLRCPACGAVQVDPLPDADTLACFYTQYAGSGGYAAKGAKKIRRARRRIDGLRRAVAGRSFLDIGCNLGFAVAAAHEAGFSASGIDVDPEAVAEATRRFPDCDFQAIDVAGLAAQDRQFDLVYCTEVIEHVAAVRPFVAALAALTRPGGLIYLTTPDVGHIRVHNRFLRWPEVKPPEHIRWFSKGALRVLFQSAGFRVEGFRPTFKPGIRMRARRLPAPAPGQK